MKPIGIVMSVSVFLMVASLAEACGGHRGSGHVSAHRGGSHHGQTLSHAHGSAWHHLSSGKPQAHHATSCPTCARDAHGRIKRSRQTREAFRRQTGYPHGRPGDVIDHIVPLKRGGSDSTANRPWHTNEEAKHKET